MTDRRRVADRRVFLQTVLGALLTACAAPVARPRAGTAAQTGGDAGTAPSASPGDAAPASGPITSSSLIVVIGAGISGISAARRLAERGFTNVVVIEARDRIGGRIHTDRSQGVPVDMGAAWVQYASDPTNPLLALAQQAGLSPVKTDWDSISVYDEQTGAIKDATLNDAEDTFQSYLDTLGTTVSADDQVTLASVLDPLETQGFTTSDQLRLLNFIVAYYIVNEYAASPAEIGAYDLSNDEPGPSSPEDDRLAGGFDTLLQWLAMGLRVQLSEVVKSVTYDDDGVTIVTSAATYQAAAAIVTLPIGVLRAGSVTFNPPLPGDKQQAINEIGFGAFEKAVLFYDEAFWPATTNAFGYASASDNPSPLWVNLQPASGTPALVAMFTADDARYVAGLSDADLQALVTQQVATMFGASSPAPKAMVRSSWTQDPYSLGCYTYPGVTKVQPLLATLAAPVGERLHFAGEATNPTWYSFAHGAYLSGIRAANEI